MTSESGYRTYLFVALVAAASIGFELLQTRVLSALYFDNVVYMTVTIALLGYGISGVMASILERRVENPDRIAVLCSAGFAVSVVVCIHIASALPGAFPRVPAVYKMIISYFVLVVPFMFAGAALSLIFMGHGKSIFGLYFADLCASAIAAVLFSVLLWPLGGYNFAWLCAAAGVIAFALRAPGVGINRLAAIPLVLSLGAGFLFLGNRIICNQPEPYKGTAWFFKPDSGAKLEATAWTTIAKIDIFSNSARDLWSGAYLGHPCDFLFLAQDNTAPTMIHDHKNLASFADDAAHHRPTEVTTLAYFLIPQPENVLVIGVGGGVDVAEARSFGAQVIDGAEINPATIDLVTRRFRDYAEWPKWNNIRIHNAEGRRFVRDSGKRYDVIVMHGVDTFAALSSGAYVLSENYLYTVEAIRDYLNALKPDGVMAIFRWFFLRPRESIRLANLFVEAAQHTGVGRPDERIMVINDGRWAGTFIKRRPFTKQEVDALAEVVDRARYSWIFVPKVLGGDQKAFEQAAFNRQRDRLQNARAAYASLITAKTATERETFVRNYPYRIDPVYDNRPFFFEYHKGKVSDSHEQNWGAGENSSSVDLTALRGPVVHSVLLVLLISTTVACLAGMGIPLLTFERDGARVDGAVGLAGFFSSLGLGFMFVEIGCMQWLNLYLGHPMYSLMVVLAGLLFFAGVGSLFAGRLTWPLMVKLRFGMLGTAILIPVWLLCMSYALPVSERWDLGARIIVVLISLLPLGLSMGMPFATGLRYLADYRPRFIPWAWGINGLTSVAASILAIIIAMRIGFTAVLLFGSGVYLLGYFAFRHHLRLSKDSEAIEPVPLRSATAA